MANSVVKFSWEDVEKNIEILAGKIKKDGFDADYIIGITKGGLVPLGLLVAKLDVDKILTVSATSYEKNEQKNLEITYLPDVNLSGMKILLVDEIADTGETLKKVSQAILDKYNVSQLKTATLIVNGNNCNYLPDFFASSVKDWIVFPWNKEEFPEYFTNV